MGYLVDSNVMIDYLAEKFTQSQLLELDEIFDEKFTISVISRIEVLGFRTTPTEEQKIIHLLGIAHIIALNEPVVEQTVLIRKRIKIKVPDAVIAATALVNGDTLLTRNMADFSRIQGLTAVNPHSW